MAIERAYITDRRLHPRRELDVKVSVRTERELLTGRTLDINESGVSAVLSGELDTGVEAELQINIPGNDVTVRAIVRGRNEFRHGFELIPAVSMGGENPKTSLPGS